MFKALILIVFFGSIAIAQIQKGTEHCYRAALNVAANKIAKDSKTKNTLLNKIGFLADSCVYSPKYQNLVCLDAKGAEQFVVELQRSTIKRKANTHTEMAFDFVTGTQGINVHYIISMIKTPTARSCSYTKTEVYKEDLED